MLTEKEMENLVAEYPDDFLEPGWKLYKRQAVYQGRRVDLIFKDRLQRTLLVEMKRGIIRREHVGQIVEYYGLLKEEGFESGVELLLIGNIIPHERRLFLDRNGIDVKEISESRFLDVANVHGYPLKDYQSKVIPETELSSKSTLKTGKRKAIIESSTATNMLLEIWKEMGGTFEKKIGPGYRLDHATYTGKGAVTFIETKSDYKTFWRFYCLRIKSENLWYKIYSEIANDFNIEKTSKGPIRAYPTHEDRKLFKRFLELSLSYWVSK